jgi:hypothetical protein
MANFWPHFVYKETNYHHPKSTERPWHSSLALCRHYKTDCEVINLYLGNVTLPVTFVELHYSPWNARLKFPTDKPARQSGQGTWFTCAREKFLKSEYATPHGYTEHDRGRAYMCHRSREDNGHYKLTVVKFGCLFLENVFAGINYPHQEHI